MAAAQAVRASSLSAGAVRVVKSASTRPLKSSAACRAVLSHVPTTRSLPRTPSFLGGAAKLPVSQVVKSARRQISSSAIRSKYVVKTEGTPDSLEFRAFIQDSEGNTVCTLAHCLSRCSEPKGLPVQCRSFFSNMQIL